MFFGGDKSRVWLKFKFGWVLKCQYVSLFFWSYHWIDTKKLSKRVPNHLQCPCPRKRHNHDLFQLRIGVERGWNRDAVVRVVLGNAAEVSAEVLEEAVAVRHGVETERGPEAGLCFSLDGW